MVRLPCCDKIGIKKGPWTPEEDITLVSYIQEHGPRNWRSVPTNTGLLRCSKSCRLRWTNYLRPGIKRGNFTSHEEGMIIYLQALFGNKWAAIASYLPQRTDNDIKNYWNTHLKKKIKKLQAAMVPHMASSDSTNIGLFSKSDIMLQDSIFRSNQASTYASSTENISRLLEGWMRSPKTHPKEKQSSISENKNKMNNNGVETNSHNFNKPKIEQERSDDLISNEDFEYLLSFENLNGIAWERSSSDSTTERKLKSENQTPVSLIETWLLDEATGPVQDMMELSSLL